MTYVPLLYELHRRRVERLRAQRVLAFEPAIEPGASIKWLRDLHDRTVQRQFAAGYYRHDEGAGVYRKTVKGTFLMTWKLLWPWKQIRLARHARKLRRELAQYPDLKIAAAAVTVRDKIGHRDPATVARLHPERLHEFKVTP